MKNIIEIKNLKKSYDKFLAVDEISFSVKKGELFAFLGVNGAGKSTVINIICQSIDKDGGKVYINGIDIDTHDSKIKRDIGVVFQGSVLDKHLTVYDNLQSRAALYGIIGEEFKNRLASLCELLELDPLLNKTVGKLSGGQKRRIDIARALVHSPRILILDEPTTGLDPKTRNLLWQVISRLQKESNMTVFLTTHYMEEAAGADYVVIIDNGKISAAGTPLELKNLYTGDYITLYGATEKDILPLGLPYKVLRDGIRIDVKSTAFAVELIQKAPELFCDFEVTKGRMDDVFLAVTGKTLGDGGDGK